MTEDFRSRLWNYLITDSIPAQAVKSAWSGVTYPGDVLAGKAKPNDVGRALDFAGVPTFGSLAVPAGKNELGMGMRAYHGSPHDFEKFDASKIGSGEGTQAYGRGIYLAENEDVAKFYRDSVSDIFGSPESLAKYYADSYGDNAASMLTKHADTNAAGYLPEDIQQLRSAANMLTSGFDPSTVKPQGHLYEVNINATPDEFIDWTPQLAQKLDDPAEIEKMKNSGIAGVKYHDQYSRDKGSGTRNFVVFDDKIIDIVKKYGISGALAAGLLTQQQADSLWDKGA